jgi:hypothetical protein
VTRYDWHTAGNQQYDESSSGSTERVVIVSSAFAFGQQDSESSRLRMRVGTVAVRRGERP